MGHEPRPQPSASPLSPAFVCTPACFAIKRPPGLGACVYMAKLCLAQPGSHPNFSQCSWEVGEEQQQMKTNRCMPSNQHSCDRNKTLLPCTWLAWAEDVGRRQQLSSPAADTGCCLGWDQSPVAGRVGPGGSQRPPGWAKLPQSGRCEPRLAKLWGHLVAQRSCFFPLSPQPACDAWTDVRWSAWGSLA